jgi:peptidoglycan/xylan/chitin deacetylase (PgdA/CDA1 family)
MNSSLFKIPEPLPINLLRRLSGVNPLIINYHIVSDETLPHIEHIYKYRSIKEFNNDLDILTKYFHPVDLHTFLDSIKKNQQLPKNSMLLTIDDGLKEIYTKMAPILLERKIPATIFLTKNYVDNYELGDDHKKSLLINRLNNLTTGEFEKLFKKYNLVLSGNTSFKDSIINISYKNRKLIDELASSVSLNFDEYLSINKPYIVSSQVKELIDQGFTFGGHSIDHPRLVELDLENQIKQAVESVDFVCKNFNINYRVFAFPYWDGGISREFFNIINKKVDATFGTQGLLKDSASINHQRIGFERFHYPVKRMIKAHYTRKIIYQLLGKGIIKRY